MQHTQAAHDGSGGRVSPGGPGGRYFGSFPDGDVCVLQGSHHPFVGRQASDLDSDVIKSGSYQGKGWEYSFPLTESWTMIVGIRMDEIQVSSDGQVFALSTPGPIKGSDLAHVALAAAAGGARFSDRPSPLAAADQSI